MGFPGTGKIWMNGKLVDWRDATIHIGSHVVHYGSGVFEGARCYSTPKGSACFRLDAHMRRLMESAKIYRMDYTLDLKGWMDAVLETIRANEMKACYIRPPRVSRLRDAWASTRWAIPLSMRPSWSGTGAPPPVTSSKTAWT
jgi:branched-chain amino acid aminotransferase